MVSQIQFIPGFNKPKTIPQNNKNYSSNVINFRRNSLHTDSFERSTPKQIQFKGAALNSLTQVQKSLLEILASVGIKGAETIGDNLTTLSKLVTKDEMTGLFNRRFLDANLPKDFAKARVAGKNFSVGFLDFDNFKGINEVLGHTTGDHFLRRIALHIREVATAYRSKGHRYGGEEFVVTMPNLDAASAKKAMEEVTTKITNDEEIQRYLPEFRRKATENLEYLNGVLKQFKRDDPTSIFRRLSKRREDSVPERNINLRDTIVTIIQNHIERYNPPNSKNLDTILKRLNDAKPKDLPELLSAKTNFGSEDEPIILGHELDRIYTQYRDSRAELRKWLGHIEKHNQFTISGGVVDAKDVHITDDGTSLVNMADIALNAAKTNGKAQVNTFTKAMQ